MWIGKIRNQITRYTSLEDFRDDMATIWENAITFNEETAEVHQWALKLRDVFEQTWAEKIAEYEARRGEATDEANLIANRNADEDDVAMTPAASSTTGGGDDVSYSGGNASRPRLNLTLNRNTDSNTASPAPSARGRGSGRGRGGRGRGGARAGRKRIMDSDDAEDDQDAEDGDSEDDD